MRTVEPRSASQPPPRFTPGGDAQDQRLMTLVGCIHGIVLEFDEHARYVNAWADDPALLAGPVETMIGRTIDEVLGAEHGAPFTAAVRRVYANGNLEQVEYPLDVDGGRRWFFADIKRVGTPETGMTVVFFARDITQRKQTEEALASREERYRLVAQATRDVLWDWDLATGVVTWGGTANTALRYAEIDPRIEWWKDRVHPDEIGAIVVSLEQTIAKGDSAWSGCYRFRLGDGTYGDFMDRAFILRDATGKPVRLVGSMIDMTQINRLQAQLLQSDRLAALGLLAAGVGHEINNPLTYVIGNLGMVLESLSPAARETRELVEESLDGARRITEIVKTLKLFGRADDTQLEPMDIQGVVEHAVRMTENEIRSRARLVRAFEPTPPVSAIESKLVQVFVNLLINASQAITEGNQEQHEIRISTGVGPCGRVFVKIEDTGCGIAADDLRRVFDPFFSTKLRGVGTGLGLSICHGIVQKLGGEITIQSELGRGTTATVFLPRAEPVVKPRPRVLVIDDEPPIGRVISRMLRELADVVVVTSGREALVRIDADGEFDMVLCDLMMPGMTGIELYQELERKHRAILPRMRFMSGGAFTPRSQEFLDRIDSTLIDKPLDPMKLRSLMGSIGKRERCVT
jgi:signal transduction histidine kinase/CheY-like chemotaxis protein